MLGISEYGFLPSHQNLLYHLPTNLEWSFWKSFLGIFFTKIHKIANVDKIYIENDTITFLYKVEVDKDSSNFPYYDRASISILFSKIIVVPKIGSLSFWSVNTQIKVSIQIFTRIPPPQIFFSSPEIHFFKKVQFPSVLEKGR